MSGWAEIRDGAVLFEDDAALVLNKPPGLSVMGERHETDLVRMAAEAGEKLYPAHRIDKVTSGALLLAKDLGLHGDLTRQFNRRSVDKMYLAITRSAGLPGRGLIELPLSVGRKNRVRVAANRAAIVFDPGAGGPGADGPGANGTGRGRWSVPAGEVFDGVRTYPSVTTFLTVAGNERHTLLAVHPVTGRRHQIRVHLAWAGHPIEGDPLFGGGAAGQAAPPPAGQAGGPAAGGPVAGGPAGQAAGEVAGHGEPGRTLLHSWRLGFTAAWAGGARIEVEAPPDAGFWAVLGGAPAALPGWADARDALAADAPSG